MISVALTRRVNELAEQGSAFVIATVVRVQRPTSVQPGNVALVRSDGTIEGFVGGVCAQHSVRLYSLKAIESGQPLLLRILPDRRVDDSGATVDDPAHMREISFEEGTVTVSNPCLSGGAIEAFLEPVLPAPRVLVAGDSPIVGALERLGSEVGLVFAPAGAGGRGGSPSAGGRAAGVAPSRGDLAVVVAAHGRDELGIVRAALEAGLPYVGLVASRKRGAAVLAQLREAGVAEHLLERLDTPAGIDIGARTAAEIALSIIARIVEVRRRAAPVARLDAGSRPITAVDPVCGMTVVVAGDTPSLVRAGETIYFCCTGCMLKYEERHGDAAHAV